MQKTTLISLTALCLALISCGHKAPRSACKNVIDTSEYEMAGGKPLWLSSKKMSLSSFLLHVKCLDNSSNGFHLMTFTNDFPETWLRRSDIDTLMTLVKSKEKCNCLINPFSSTMERDGAEIGGYAIALIKSYRENRRFDFGLNFCPKVNDEEIFSLVEWWNENQNAHP